MRNENSIYKCLRILKIVVVRFQSKFESCPQVKDFTQSGHINHPSGSSGDQWMDLRD